MGPALKTEAVCAPTFFIFISLFSSCGHHYRAEGVVLSVYPERPSVVISHRAIPKYMDAMAMEFSVLSVKELRGLAPGSRVDFRLSVGQKRSRVSDIRVKTTKLEDVVLPPQARKLSVGDPIAAFTLIDQNGREVRLADYLGHPVVIDFIYTRCPLPDVCPRLSANFALLQKRFGDKLTLLSITIDPLFDTPEVLGEYAKRWRAGSDWHFLTGSPEQIQQIAAPFGLVYWAEEGVISHTSATVIVTPDGRMSALLEGSTFTAKQLVDLVESTLHAR